MCNWVVNKLTIKGDNVKEKLLKHFLKDEHGDYVFDFNTIIKMPDELNVERSSASYDGFRLYLAKLNPFISNYGTKDDKIFIEDFSKKILSNYKEDAFNNLSKYILKPTEIEELKIKYGDRLDEITDMGKTVFNNKIKYGCDDWYDFRIKYWGTKWNSCNTYHNDDLTMICFDTAWSPSIPVIKALAKLYPDLTIIHEWAEEQTGWYSGKYTYKNGELIEELDYESYSKEAYELSFELWGNDDQYQFNPKINNYEYKGEE